METIKVSLKRELGVDTGGNFYLSIQPSSSGDLVEDNKLLFATRHLLEKREENTPEEVHFDKRIDHAILFRSISREILLLVEGKVVQAFMETAAWMAGSGALTMIATEFIPSNPQIPPTVTPPPTT